MADKMLSATNYSPILQMSTPISASEFDELVLKTSQAEIGFAEAHERLRFLYSNSDLWKCVIQIYSESVSQTSKFYILSYFRNFVAHSWHLIPHSYKDIFSAFFFQLIISEGPNSALTSMIDAVMVEILKKDWPNTWSTFVADLISSTKGKNPINSIRFLSAFLQEIFSKVGYGLSSIRRTELEAALLRDSLLIIQLLRDFFSECTSEGLILSAMDYLQVFLRWLDPSYFQGQFLGSLVGRFFPSDQFKKPVLLCFSSLTKSESSNPALSKLIETAFPLLIEQLKQWITEDFKLSDLSIENHELLSALISALCDFLSFGEFHFLIGLEEGSHAATAVQWIIELTKVANGTTLEVCLELWSKLVRECLISSSTLHLPEEYIKKLQDSLVEKLYPPKSYEVGSSELPDSFKDVCDILSDSAKIDRVHLMNSLLDGVSSPDCLQAIQACWGMAAISGSMEEAEEDEYITEAIGKLGENFVGLTIISMGYSRYLLKNFNILSSILTNLIDCIKGGQSQSNQRFAVLTFSELARSCSSFFLSQVGASFLAEVISQVPSMIQGISVDLLAPFYSSIAFIASKSDPQVKTFLVDSILRGPMSVWMSAFSQFKQGGCICSNFSVILSVFSSILGAEDSMISSKLKPFAEECFEVFRAGNFDIDVGEEIYSVFMSVFRCNADPEFSLSIAQAVIDDSLRSEPQAKSAQALACIEVFIQRVGLGQSIFQRIFDLIEATAQSLSEAFLPDVCTSLLSMVSAVFKSASLETLDPEAASRLFDVLFWGLGLVDTEAVSIVLNLILYIVENVEGSFSATFFSLYYRPLVSAVFKNLINAKDDGIFTMFCRVASVLISGVSKSGDEEEAVAELITGQLALASEDADQQTVFDFVVGLIEGGGNFQRFKESLRDFVVDKDNGEFSKSDDGELETMPSDESFDQLPLDKSRSIFGFLEKNGVRNDVAF